MAGVWSAGSSSEDEGGAVGGGAAALNTAEIAELLNKTLFTPEMLEARVIKERNAALDAYDEGRDRKSGARGFRIGDRLLVKEAGAQVVGVIFHVASGPDTPLSAQVLREGGGTQVLAGSELHNARNNFKNQLDSGKIADTHGVRRVDFIAEW